MIKAKAFLVLLSLFIIVFILFFGLKEKGFFSYLINNSLKEREVEVKNGADNFSFNNSYHAIDINQTSTNNTLDSLPSPHINKLGSKILASDKYLEANLTRMTLTLYDKNKPLKTYTILHKGPEDKWFRSPTGYFQVLSKEKNHFSSFFPVYMPYSLRFYEDFYIHGIPYYPNGEKVPPRFTGGCLRLDDKDAEEVYEFASVGTPVIVFDEVKPLKSQNWQLPLDENDTWIRQNFNNPVKINGEYFQHAGVDLVNLKNKTVRAAADGLVAHLEVLSPSDHGLGYTVILEHNINSQRIYSLYAHLSSLNPDLKIGQPVKRGEVLGEMGASGYGCNFYWRVGKDGCNETSIVDYHLHFEIKKAAVLYNPEGGFVCGPDKNQPCYGYTPKYPTQFGYYDPLAFMSQN